MTEVKLVPHRLGKRSLGAAARVSALLVVAGMLALSYSTAGGFSLTTAFSRVWAPKRSRREPSAPSPLEALHSEVDDFRAVALTAEQRAAIAHVEGAEEGEGAGSEAAGSERERAWLPLDLQRELRAGTDPQVLRDLGPWAATGFTRKQLVDTKRGRSSAGLEPQLDPLRPRPLFNIFVLAGNVYFSKWEVDKMLLSYYFPTLAKIYAFIEQLKAVLAGSEPGSIPDVLLVVHIDPYPLLPGRPVGYAGPVMHPAGSAPDGGAEAWPASDGEGAGPSSSARHREAARRGAPAPATVASPDQRPATDGGGRRGRNTPRPRSSEARRLASLARAAASTAAGARLVAATAAAPAPLRAANEQGVHAHRGRVLRRRRRRRRAAPSSTRAPERLPRDRRSRRRRDGAGEKVGQPSPPEAAGPGGKPPLNPRQRNADSGAQAPTPSMYALPKDLAMAAVMEAVDAGGGGGGGGGGGSTNYSVDNSAGGRRWRGLPATLAGFGPVNPAVVRQNVSSWHIPPAPPGVAPILSLCKTDGHWDVLYPK